MPTLDENRSFQINGMKTLASRSSQIAGMKTLASRSLPTAGDSRTPLEKAKIHTSHSTKYARMANLKGQSWQSQQLENSERSRSVLLNDQLARASKMQNEGSWTAVGERAQGRRCRQREEMEGREREENERRERGVGDHSTGIKIHESYFNPLSTIGMTEMDSQGIHHSKQRIYCFTTSNNTVPAKPTIKPTA